MKANSKNKISINLILIIYLALCVVSAREFWPGTLSADFLSILTGAQDGKITNFGSPGASFLLTAWLRVYDGYGPLFVGQLIFYWIGCALIAVMTLQRLGNAWAFFATATSVSPPAVYLLHVASLDAILMGQVVFAAGLCLHASDLKSIKRQAVILPPLILIILSLALVKYVGFFFSAAIFSALLICLGRTSLLVVDEPRLFVFTRFVTLYALVALTFLILNMAVAFYLAVGSQSYLSRFTIKYDLVSMSVLNDHSGVTRDLDPQEKLTLEKELAGSQWFIGLNKSIYRDVPSLNDRVDIWLKAITADPLLYLKMRWGVFVRIFNGEARPEIRGEHYYWKFFKGYRADRTAHLRGDYRSEASDGWFVALYESFNTLYVKWIFLSPTIPAASIITSLVLLLARKKDFYSNFYVLTTAFLIPYYVFLFFIIQVPMHRYAVPPLALQFLLLPLGLGLAKESISGSLNGYRGRN